jgi:hypothetical protein
MMVRSSILPLAIVVAAVLGLAGCGGTTLEFTLTDAVSGSWVWNATVRCQDHSMRLFFQSDHGPVSQRFTGLSPGACELVVEAAGYQMARLPIRLQRGANRLASPVRMIGIDLPGFDYWLIAESAEGRDVIGELRPVATDGTTVINHPCLDLWIGARISVQVRNGTPTQEKTEQGASRGEELFRGSVPWQWNDSPEKTFRYSLRIPGSRIKASSAPYRVIDYLVVVPYATRITRPEVESLMAGLHWEDPDGMVRTLTAEQGRMRWQFVTSWNVKAGLP